MGKLTALILLAAAPELFAPGVISTVDDETSIAFTPDGRTAYFTKRSPTTNTPPRWFICRSHLEGGKWSEPEVAAFSGLDNDLGPALSTDGRRLVFASDRPLAPDAGPGRRPLALWSLELQPDGSGSAPRPLPAPVNAEGDSFGPALAADGTLYFASSRPGGKGSVDLYRATPADGGYSVEGLSEINSPAYEGQPAVAPDQRFLLFTGLGREDGQVGPGYPYPRADLYLSVRTATGFGPPRHVRELNTPATEASPSLSPDQRFLFFASDRGFATVPMRRRLTAAAFRTGVQSLRNGWSNLYRVPLEALDLRAAEPKAP